MGSYAAPCPGVVTLKWDNSYSWSRGKQLGYVAEVFSPDLMVVAQEAAADLAALQERYIVLVFLMCNVCVFITYLGKFRRAFRTSMA